MDGDEGGINASVQGFSVQCSVFSVQCSEKSPLIRQLCPPEL